MPSEIIAKTPNILVLMVDQMRSDYMGCAGNPWMKTPALDRLAAEGARFTRCVTSVPVCVAARHSFMTGHRCSVHGRYGNNVPNPEPMVPTVQQILGLNGYRTRAIGKMHFRPVRRHFGFHQMELMEEIPDFREEDEYLMYLDSVGYGQKREVHGVRNLLYHLPQVSVIPEEHHGSTWVANRTIDFLASNKEKPFFCWSSWIAPHPPWNPPEPFASMYDPEALPLPHNFERDINTLPGRHRGITNAFDMGGASPELLRRVKALYGGSISLIDKGVGRILNTLDDLGLAENTMVVFVSDHGEMMGDHGLWQKGIPYEGSVRVPMLVKMPGRVDAGIESDEPVSLLDLMPTFLDVAETAYPGQEELAGASLIGRPGGGLADKRDRMVVEIGRGESRWLSVREGDWKYNVWLADGWRELYELAEDPNEDRNLLLGSVSEDDATRAGTMHDYLTEWEAEHGFDDSFDENGALIDHGRAAEDTSEARVNGQFPRWVLRLPDSDRAAMESPGETVVNAIRHETTFRLEELNLAGFGRSGGSLEGTRFAHLVESEEQSE
jgi:arylsulfatase A-like enzyme